MGEKENINKRQEDSQDPSVKVTFKDDTDNENQNASEREMSSDDEEELFADRTNLKIDLKRVKSAYRDSSHTESNLPNVLAEYGLQDKEGKESKGRNRSLRKKNTGSPKFSEDTESNEKRKKKREESSFSRSSPRRSTPKKPVFIRENSRYAQLVEDHKNNPEGGQFYSKKVSVMMKRLGTPRNETISLRKDVHVNKEKEKHVHKKKLEKHILTSNSGFLKDLPKSEIGKVIELQDKLMKEGKLKTQVDVDKFRQEIKNPEVFNSYFNKKSSDAESGTGSVAASTIQSLAGFKRPSVPQDHPPRSLSHISETSRPVTREDWAVTHQFPAKNAEKKEPLSRKQAMSELEKRFPKPVMPPLKCFTMELGEKPPDPEEIQRQVELKVRIKQRKKFLRKLQRMHQMAMAHGAAASRIMENYGDIGQLLEGNSLRDVISVLPAPEDAYITAEDLAVPAPGFALEDGSSRQQSRTSGTRTLTSHGSRESLQSRDSRLSVTRGASRQQQRKKLISREKRKPQVPSPLTMDEIREKTKIIEAKCLSTKWTNYMKTAPVKAT